MTKTTKLGTTGPEVFPLALGCMGMTPGVFAPPKESEGIATIHAAIDRGVTLLDTGDFYSMGENEALIRRAIEGKRDKVQLSVKFGALRSPDGGWAGFDTRPVAIGNFLAYSLKRLGTDVIDIYRPTRLDRSVPIEETIGAIADYVKKGYVKHIGLSEVGVETIRRAAAVHPIVDLQVEYSLAARGPEAKIFPVLEELGVSATIYGVLVHGLLSGSKITGPQDFRNFLPQFADEHRQKNDAVVASVREFAADRGQTPAQLCIAWALAKQPRLVPTIGVRTTAQLESMLAALDKPLGASDVAELETIVNASTIGGERLPETFLAHSEA